MDQENDEKQTAEISTRERFHNTLVERAEQITSVRNDVYTTSWWQIAFNFFFGFGAVALLIVSMVMEGTTSTVCAIVGVVLVVVVLVANLASRAYMPTSFLQYTCKANGKRYCFQVLSKTRSGFSDGEHNIEVDRGEAVMLPEMSYSQYRYDFFVDMDVDMRIGKVDTETFVGTIERNGKTYKSKIVFKDGAPLFGTIGGVRIKYFDVNSNKEKFVVPAALRRAVKGFDVVFPKLSGLVVKDEKQMKDARKQ
ncbi:MAG: hypothetical protein HDT28_00425 [Clostridiales bacterium]|nr:hypothetical protein [Clostridiales bacterium]